jgi:hypothetical protein
MEPEKTVNEEESKDQQWTGSTSNMPKQFSFCNIKHIYRKVQKKEKQQKNQQEKVISYSLKTMSLMWLG